MKYAFRCRRCITFSMTDDDNWPVLKGYQCNVVSVVSLVIPFLYCRNLGNDQQLVVFKFDGFKIGRYLTVEVTDPHQVVLEPTAPFQRRKPHSLYQQSETNSGDSWVVPGQRPARSSSFSNMISTFSHILTKYSHKPFCEFKWIPCSL